MKRMIGLVVGAILLLVVLLALSSALYTVHETHQVVITQFGKPVGRPISTPGLKIKMPFVQQTNAFEKRFLEWDGEANEVPTRDKRFIRVDTYARWHITDPLLFFQRLRDERGAQSRLDDIIDGETRNTVANHDLIELVRSTNREFERSEGLPGEEENEDIGTIRFGRQQLTAEVLAAARGRTRDLGIEILDFRFKRIDYVVEVQQEVYSRMISERQRIAEQFRSEGAGEAAEIQGEKERDLQVIQSEAYRRAQELRGAAEAESTRIYAQAYGRDPDFYRFLQSMETLKKTFDDKTTLLLSTEGELLRHLDSAR